jgi:hypothetical protein
MEAKMSNLDKKTLMQELELFANDKDRGISLDNFCEVAGISSRLFRYVILEKTMPMTELTQRRLNKAYRDWKDGRIKVMKKRNNETYPDYRKEPQVPMLSVSKLVLTNNGFKIQNKPVNRHDYANFNNILVKRG